jgi:predicted secreted protein
MKRLSLVLLLGTLGSVLFASDAAVLLNLGFSDDGRYFMFGQHVFVTDGGQAYAELAVVDIPTNDFVPGGHKKGRWDAGIRAGQSSLGGLLELLEDAAAVKEKYGIRHLEMGRPLYVRLDGEGEEGDLLEFRDFETGRRFRLSMAQESAGDDADMSASFGLTLGVTDSRGLEKDYLVGRPGFSRSGVASYRIDRVWMAPDGRGLVIAVAKIASDLSIRYMVETLRIDG